MRNPLLLALLVVGLSACDAGPLFGGRADVCAADAGEGRVDYFPIEAGSLGQFDQVRIYNSFGQPYSSFRDTVEVVVDDVACSDGTRTAPGRVLYSDGSEWAFEIRETEEGVVLPWTASGTQQAAFPRYFDLSADETVALDVGTCSGAGGTARYAALTLSRSRGLERIFERCNPYQRDSNSFSLTRIADAPSADGVGDREG